MSGIVQVPLDTLCKIKDGTTTFDKSCKIGTNAIGAVDVIAKAVSGSSSAYQPLSNLASQMKIFSGLVGGLNILSRAQEILCKNDKIKDYVWKTWKAKKGNVAYDWMRPDWTPKGISLTKDQKLAANRKIEANRIQDPVYWSGMKITSQAFLTAAHAISAVEFLKTLGFYSLGAATPFVSLAKNVLYIPASTFGLADAAYKIHMSKVYKNNCENKVRKWADRTNMSLDDLQDKYAQKIDNAKAKIAALDMRSALPKLKAQERKAITLFNEHMQNKILRWETYQNQFRDLKNENLNSDDTKTVLINQSQLGKDCQYKISKWTDIVKVAKYNQKVENTKNGINIAYQILKITFGIIGVTLATLAILASFGVMAPVAPLALTIMAIITGFGWAVTESVGLSKEIYGFFRSSRKIEKPHFPKFELASPSEDDVDEDSSDDGVVDDSEGNLRKADPNSDVSGDNEDDGAVDDSEGNLRKADPNSDQVSDDSEDESVEDEPKGGNPPVSVVHEDGSSDVSEENSLDESSGKVESQNQVESSEEITLDNIAQGISLD